MNINFLFTLGFYEVILLLSLFVICLRDLIINYKNKNWIYIFNPLTLFSLLTIFYCLVGPLVTTTLADGSIIYRAENHREFYQIGLFAALISYLSFKLGFEYKNKFKLNQFGINNLKEIKIEKKDYLFFHKWGERVILFTLFLQFIIYGTSLINKIFSINNEIIAPTYGLFVSYFSYSVNFFIIGIILIFVALLNGSKERTKFIFYFTITIGIFLNLGFRYRLLLLFLPLFIIYFFYKKIKPSLKLLLSIFISTVLLFGLVQTTRSYGSGLNFDKYQRKYGGAGTSFVGNIFKAAFYDANIFHTSAALIYKTPKEYNYVGISPILNALALPIPRAIWENKPRGEYIIDAYRNIYKGIKEEVGAASLGFAEYYLSGGWIVLVTVNFFIGLFYKKVWSWLILNFKDPLAQSIYCVNLSYLYMIFSRGYLLQLFYIYLSIFIPIIFISKMWNRKFKQ